MSSRIIDWIGGAVVGALIVGIANTIVNSFQSLNPLIEVRDLLESARRARLHNGAFYYFLDKNVLLLLLGNTPKLATGKNQLP